MFDLGCRALGGRMQDLAVQVLASVRKFPYESWWVYTWGVSLEKA